MHETVPLQRTLRFVTQGNNKRIDYVLTLEDYVVLSRAVEYEGEPRDGVAWTLLQRFAFLYPTYKSLATFIRAYAQPINPDWFPTGSKHKDWIDKLVAAGKYNEADDERKRAAKRANFANTPLSKISKPTRDIIDYLFLSGQSPIPGSIHYRAPTVETASVPEAEKAREAFARKYQLPRIIDYGNPTKHNWFFGSSKSASFRMVAMLNQSTLVHAAVALAYTSGLAHMLYQLTKVWRYG